jgi:hypothetical protein
MTALPQKRNDTVAFRFLLRYDARHGIMEVPIMKLSSGLIAAVAAAALISMPLAPASAHGRHHGGGLLFGVLALGTAAVVGAATIATAPVRALAAPVYAPPPAYAPPAYAYAPPPAAYYPPPAYAPPPAYYYPPR